ncbi:MAG TPA: hypothetical protein PLO67_04380 [Saprospiraceae bacterium]|nr:hypothetical protein [Saprospiraceae bacterium]HPI04865.1 hypothetical protein [Saprospiraceae bacterium]
MKLLSLLKSLHPEEHRGFEKFLQSPYFKDSGQYLQFFRYLSKRYPAFDVDNAGMREAYRRCFQMKTLPTDVQLHNLTSGMSKQAEQFLVAQIVLDPEQATGSLFDQLLVKALGMRNQGAYFRKEADNLIGKISSQPALHADDFFTIQQLYRLVYFNPDTPKTGNYSSCLEQSAVYLDLYYCTAKLRDAAEMKAREHILKARYDIPLLDAVLQQSAVLNATGAFPLLEMYSKVIDLYNSGVDEPGFRHLLAMYDTQFVTLSKEDRVLIIRHLINCGITLNAREDTVETELFSLYKRSIEAGSLLDGKRITNSSFVNIANLASRCGDFDWALHFIREFSVYLEKSKQEPVVQLAKAGVFYNQGLLDTAHECLLLKEIFLVPAFDLLARSLLIKIAFDRFILYNKDYEFLCNQMNAFEKAVPNKDLTPEKKVAQLNWVKFLRKMSRARFELVSVPDGPKEALLKKLKALQPVVYKQWLEKRIGML